jgi:hypothetical protein
MKRGKGYAVNVPLRDGITDDAFHSIFKPVHPSLVFNFLLAVSSKRRGSQASKADVAAPGFPYCNSPTCKNSIEYHTLTRAPVRLGLS